MENAILGACVGAAAALVLVAVVLGVRRGHRTRADLEAMLDAAQRESDDLRHRLDEVLSGRNGQVESNRGPDFLSELFPERRSVDARPAPEPVQAEFVITRAGEPDRLDSADQVVVPDRLVLSATLGEPLVKVAAFSHGVRRALSAESRNRIRFEMRREVKAARKRRRRQVRDHLRETRATERAGGVA